MPVGDGLCSWVQAGGAREGWAGMTKGAPHTHPAAQVAVMGLCAASIHLDVRCHLFILRMVRTAALTSYPPTPQAPQQPCTLPPPAHRGLHLLDGLGLLLLAHRLLGLANEGVGSLKPSLGSLHGREAERREAEGG